MNHDSIHIKRRLSVRFDDTVEQDCALHCLGDLVGRPYAIMHGRRLLV